ncbi:MAG: 2-C-methyl-D-erythritol 2,4-cyclodiphosphate synthase [Acidobacteriota bacterium]
MFKVGIGQDSHRFDSMVEGKTLVLGGIVFEGESPLQGNSDADVVLHSITNAVSSITGVNVIGKLSDAMCREGITDSMEYLKVALSHLDGYQITHVAVTIECKAPMISPKIAQMKDTISRMMGISPKDVGITATTGEGLTAFGRGEGIQAISIVTAMEIR